MGRRSELPGVGDAGRNGHWRWCGTCSWAIVVMILLAPVGRADVLLTADGHRVQTTGAWVVKGSTVEFKDAKGHLTSLRLDEVDLKASREATDRAARMAHQEDPVEEAEDGADSGEPVRVFTDREFTTVNPHQQNEALEGSDSESGGKPFRLRVKSWQEVEPDISGGTTIVGSLANVSDEVLAEVALVANLVGEGGEVLASQAARLESRVLRPGQSTGFKVNLDGFFAYARVEFQQTSVPLLLEGRPSDN